LTDAALPDASVAPPRPDLEVIHRHTLVVRVTHWINLLCVTLLLLSGLQIFNAHPRLYWGQAGADHDHAFIEMLAYPTGVDQYRGETHVGALKFHTTGFLGASGGEARGFPKWLTLPAERNLAVGRRWHFFMAWLLVINGGVYVVSSLVGGHFRRDLALRGEELSGAHIWRSIVDHIRLKHPTGEAAKRYNVLQKLAYLAVIALLAAMVFTGLTLSPGIDAFAPWLVALFGGRQSARTIHFICANLIVLFVLVHLIEVFLAGVVNEVGSMITGRYAIRTGDHP